MGKYLTNRIKGHMVGAEPLRKLRFNEQCLPTRKVHKIDFVTHELPEKEQTSAWLGFRRSDWFVEDKMSLDNTLERTLFKLKRIQKTKQGAQ